MRNRNTIEFLGTWELLNNIYFKVEKFDHFKIEAGLFSFVLSPGRWIKETNSIGIFVKRGKYGGTYAHKDIALEFCSAISPIFKLYLIKEFQKLKARENDNQNIEWETKRFLSKANYLIHTDAIKKYIIPGKDYKNDKKWLIYASEADLLNVVLFDCTAKDWRNANKELSKEYNIRDFASINELVVLSNLESYIAKLIQDGISKVNRFEKLSELCKYQLSVLNESDKLKELKSSK